MNDDKMKSIFYVLALCGISILRITVPKRKVIFQLATTTVPKENVVVSKQPTVSQVAKVTLNDTAVEEPPMIKSTEDRPRKFYAIHIGPSKTAISKIEKDLARNPFRTNTLEKDNIIYVGKITDTESSKKEIRKVRGISIKQSAERKQFHKAVYCMETILENFYMMGTDSKEKNKERLETDEETRAYLKTKFTNDCWSQRSNAYMLDHSIIDMNEMYSLKKGHKQYVSSDTLGSRFLMFDILGYERLIVVGQYRRYADWIVSTYTQSISSCLRKNLGGGGLSETCPSMKEFLEVQAKKEGTDKFNSYHFVNLHSTLPQIVKAGPSKLESKIMNWHQLPHEEYDGVKFYKNMKIEFYCDAIGEELMPHTCKKAQEMESRAFGTGAQVETYRRRRLEHDTGTESKDTSPVANKGSYSDSIYQSIVAAGYRKNLINSKSTTNYKELSDYHSIVLGLDWTEHIPLLCPSREELSDILQRSLELEKLLLPEFKLSPLGTKEHVRLFWDDWYGQQKLYCWVDIPKLFRKASSWDDIINERIVNYDWDTIK